MRILLTNDDGYTSPGLCFLAKTLREAGHRVFIVAPDSNRSACSHSIHFLHGPLKLHEIEKDTWSCSGTPADCVIVGLLGGILEIDIEKNPPDLVLSGINSGENLGTDIVYSGTAAAARQGSFFGIPSIALSLVENGEKWHWQAVSSYITGNLSAFMGYWKEGSFVNINFPNIEKNFDFVVPVFPSMRYYNDRIINYWDPNGRLYCFTKFGKAENEPDEGSDWAEVKKNKVALSVVKSQPAIMEG